MADTETTRPRRIWRILFALSVALNVAVVGVVLGVGLRDRVGGQSPRGFDFALGPIGRVLDQEDRRAIGDALRADPALRPMRRAEGRVLMESIAEALTNVPFSEDDMAALLETAGGRAVHIQAAARAAFVDRVAQMSDEERATLAERIMNPRARKR